MEPVVLDHGTSLLKAGYANPENDPSLVLSSEVCPSEPKTEAYSLDPAAYTRDIELKAYKTVERGYIKDWDAMEDVWNHVFYDQLGWEVGNEGQVLVAEPLFNPRTSRERAMQIMFERFNVSGYFSVEQLILSLYAFGRTSGCVADVGHGKTEIGAVMDGALLHSTARRWEVAGQDLDQHLLQLLRQSKQLPETLVPCGIVDDAMPWDYRLVKSLRENCCEVAESETALSAHLARGQEQASQKEQHILPDGQVITLSASERWGVPESLIRPKLLGRSEHGLAEQLLQCATLSGTVETQRVLADNIVLVGGTSCTQGLAARFMNDIAASAPPYMRPTLLKAPEYMPENTGHYAAWIGGAILSKVVFPQQQHITKGEYDEHGPSVVHRKCY